MKSIGKGLRLAGVALLALCTSCAGSDAVTTPAVEPTATATPALDEPTPDEPTSIAAPSPTATPVPAPERSDDERIAGVLAALEANGVDGLLAWDVLDASVRDDEVVAVTLCGWTGETIYDNVYTSLWNDEVDGEPVEAGTSITSGECLNTHLIDTAFETIREFDLFRIDISADPASFTTDTRARLLLAEEIYPVTEEGIVARIEDGVTAIPEGFDGALPGSAVAPLLFRRLGEPEPVLEVASCRMVNADAGLYRDGVLILSANDEGANGPHAIDWYQLVRRENRWQVRQSEGFGFGDCFVNGDWPGEIAGWKTGEAWTGL